MSKSSNIFEVLGRKWDNEIRRCITIAKYALQKLSKVWRNCKIVLYIYISYCSKHYLCGYTCLSRPPVFLHYFFLKQCEQTRHSRDNKGHNHSPSRNTRIYIPLLSDPTWFRPLGHRWLTVQPCSLTLLKNGQPHFQIF